VNTLLYFGNARLPAEQVEQRYRQAYQYFEQAGSRWDVAMAMLVHVSFAQYNIVDMQLARRLCQQSLALFRELGDRFGMVLALNSQAALSYELGDYEEVIQAGLEGRELAQQLGDRWRVATALLILGQARVAQGEYAKAEAVYLESLVLVRELGNRRVVARYLACLGYVYYLENKLTAAQDLFLEGLELSRQIDDRREMAMSSMNLGNIAQSNSNLAEARRRYLFAINILKEIPFARWEFSICLKRMGSLCVLSGERSSAWDYYRRALVISQQLKRVPEMLDNLVGMAELLIQEGRYEPAVELLTLALAHTETAQDVLARSEVLLADLETRLTPLEFSRANTRGQGLSPDEAADSWISAVDQP
jgi:tetratricopeptide (TPR) repeat protein